VASLPPLAAEVFAEKVLSAQETTNAAAAKASFNQYCEPCQKWYYSENSFRNHVGSQKHKQKVIEAEDAESMISSMISFPTIPTPSTDTDSVLDGSALAERMAQTSISASSAVDESIASPFARCLFCRELSSTVHFNMIHMGTVHSMYIPEIKYLSDLEGLLTYLREKIEKDHECLFCGRMSNTTEGILQHMIGVGHCMIGYDSEEQQLEIGQYYDFRSTYSDSETDSESDDDGVATPQGSGVKLGARRKEKVEGEEEEGEDWETDSESDSSVDSDEIGSIPIDGPEVLRDLSKHPHHSSSSRTHLNKDGYHSHAHSHSHAVFRSEYELFMPSGRQAGHRSLQRYFRQNLHNRDLPGTADHKAITDGTDADSDSERRGRQRGLAVSRRNLGMVGVAENKKKAVKAMERRERQAEGREMRKLQWVNNRKANHQKHFRDQLLGTAA
jgi:pre-60S factor REI1